jgi:thymidylate synthase (FAD)
MKTSDIEVTLIDSCGSDLSVVNAARVSFDKESGWEIEEGETPWDTFERLSTKDAKLISYLAKHEHTSPFNHCFASFRVKAPIFVARQLVKHKFLPWNEVSRRYVDSEPEFFLPPLWREKADNVKQGSSEREVGDPWKAANWAQNSAATALFSYQSMLAEGVCPEQARMVLPQNTMTEWIWSGTLGAWADMCRLRLDSHSQLETRRVAEKIGVEMYQLFPVSWNALLGYDETNNV